MHRSNLKKYRGAFSSVDLLNKCESIPRSSLRISPLRGLTGYLRAAKTAMYESWLVPEKNLVPDLAKTLFFGYARHARPL